jgi:hypothetical protein
VSYLVVGAPGASSAIRYEYEPAGPKVTTDTEFTRADGKTEGGFGHSVAISSYGNGVWSLVGAPGNPTGGLGGGGFLYADGEPAPAWMQPPEVLSSPTARYSGNNLESWQKFTPKIPKYLP